MKARAYDLVAAWVRPAETVLVVGLVLLLWPVFTKMDLVFELGASGLLESFNHVLLQSLFVAGTTAIITTLAAYFGAFYLSYCVRYGALISAVMLVPYAVSYYAHLLAMRSLATALLGGLQSVFLVSTDNSYSLPLMVGSMAVRYFPLALVFVFLRFNSLPSDLLVAGRNLGVRPLKLHFRVLIPHSRLILLFLGVFLLCLTAMDQLAPSIGAGGRFQTLGSLVDDWQRTQSLRDFSIGLGGSISLLVASAVLAVTIPVTRDSGTPGLHRRIQGGTVAGWDGRIGVATLVTIGSVFLLAQTVWLLSLGEASNRLELFREAVHRFPVSVLRNSGAAAVLTCVLGVLTGLLSAFAMHLVRNPKFRYLQDGAMPVAMLLPLLLPPLAVGICLRESIGQMGLGVGNWWLVGIGHLFIYMPVAWFVCGSTNARLGGDLVQAARNHGVSVGRYFWRVYLPQARVRALVAGGLLFFLSMNEAVISPYLCGFDRTLGEYIQRSQVSGMGPAEGLLLGILTVGTVGFLVAGGWLLEEVARAAAKRMTRRQGEE